MKFGRLLVGLVLALVCAAGCANPEYDAGAAHDELVRAGLTEEQASCYANGVVDTFSVDQLTDPAFVQSPAGTMALQQLQGRCF